MGVYPETRRDRAAIYVDLSLIEEAKRRIDGE